MAGEYFFLLDHVCDPANPCIVTDFKICQHVDKLHCNQCTHEEQCIQHKKIYVGCSQAALVTDRLSTQQ